MNGTNRLAVALFIGILWLPLAANLAGRDGADAAAEKRELASFPAFDASWRSFAAFGDGFTRWFEDHFGFRSTLVRWYGEGALFALGVSPSAQVIMGRDGWLFYADDSGLEDYASETPLTPAELANWRTAIVGIRDWLHMRGIAYVFTIAPDKHVIYPEAMPASIHRIGAQSRLDQVIAAVSAAGVTVVDLRGALRAGKARERLYQKTDSHWNERGALIAYQQIVNAARAQLPGVTAPWTHDDFESGTTQREGMDLAAMMGLVRVLREEDLTLVPKHPRLAQVIEPQGALTSDHEGRLVTEVAGSELPRAVVFRDSFFSQLAPFVSEHFSRTVYVWQDDFDADVVLKERPNLVIQEIVGRHLHGFVPTPRSFPN